MNKHAPALAYPLASRTRQSCDASEGKSLLFAFRKKKQVGASPVAATRSQTDEVFFASFFFRKKKTFLAC
jgi:hypothetical protein